ncbi:mechanosensitive ion channel family protein [Butyricimonas paravirosa]|mgnify:CR=1 FL=1|uniref:mechanosensitive ion channel family protein n=1 Tax=Butyricimonas paravirosa TaxID=1472417 RepID=UPI00210B0BF8|nr:mechanosensitive ion channel family protein [Butyricimonas paravirosa]MCQ4873622.1 mechanosensitive ion channel family protein [Butyricimonas paravirosa]
MKNYLILLCLILGTISCGKKSSISDFINRPDDSQNPYTISSTHVGPIARGTNIRQLYAMYPPKQIKLIKNKGGFFNQEFDDYNIYDRNGNLLFTATPEVAGDTSSFINRIIIRDTSFKTSEGIGLNSTLGQLRNAYHNINFLPSSGEIVVSVPKVSTNFLINKTNLDDSWWDNNTNQVIEKNIPDSTHIDGVVVFWNTKEAQHTPAIFTAVFWNEMLTKLVTWCVIELPSIAILIILFVSLLRALRFTTQKMKKIAINKAHRAENIDDNEAEKRINTLTGIIHGIGRIFLWVIFLLILLGKFNINIAPILASAGIVGLAVGFGAQELVRDFISGFFILLEDQLRTGDWAVINGTEGLVEKIELRTVTLRDSSGTVHIFQNGKINTLSNMTKEWSAIVLQIGIGYKEDTDNAVMLMQQVGDEMFNDPVYREMMLEPISISGVNDFADSAVVIRLVLKTKPMQQWAVGREYRRRLKKVFDAKNVEFPFPYRTLTWGDSSNPIKLKIETSDSDSK